MGGLKNKKRAAIHLLQSVDYNHQIEVCVNEGKKDERDDRVAS